MKKSHKRKVLISYSKMTKFHTFLQSNELVNFQKCFLENKHLIVVSDTTTVTVDHKKYLVRPNESTYIKMGQNHRLENEGKIPVVPIEAQVGEYTGENDIVRIEDDYNYFKGKK